MKNYWTALRFRIKFLKLTSAKARWHTNAVFTYYPGDIRDVDYIKQKNGLATISMPAYIGAPVVIEDVPVDSFTIL